MDREHLAEWLRSHDDIVKVTWDRIAMLTDLEDGRYVVEEVKGPIGLHLLTYK